MKKFTLVFNLFIVFSIFVSCASMKNSYFLNPAGVRGDEIKKQFDPLLDLEIDTVKAYVPRIMGSRSSLILHEKVVNPNYSEFFWSNQRPFFFQKDTVKSVLAELGSYDILIYNMNRREVNNQRGYNSYGLSKEQRTILNNERRRNTWSRYWLFERVQLTFRDGKLIHWCWQCVL